MKKNRVTIQYLLVHWEHWKLFSHNSLASQIHEIFWCQCRFQCSADPWDFMDTSQVCFCIQNATLSFRCMLTPEPQDFFQRDSHTAGGSYLCFRTQTFLSTVKMACVVGFKIYLSCIFLRDNDSTVLSTLQH
jgi:hypothetical protein